MYRNAKEQDSSFFLLRSYGSSVIDPELCFLCYCFFPGSNVKPHHVTTGAPLGRNKKRQKEWFAWQRAKLELLLEMECVF